VLKAVAAGKDGSASVTDWMTRHPDTIEPADTTITRPRLMIHGGFRHSRWSRTGRSSASSRSAISCGSRSTTARRAACSWRPTGPAFSSLRCGRSSRSTSRRPSGRSGRSRVTRRPQSSTGTRTSSVRCPASSKRQAGASPPRACIQSRPTTTSAPRWAATQGSTRAWSLRGTACKPSSEPSRASCSGTGQRGGPGGELLPLRARLVCPRGDRQALADARVCDRSRGARGEGAQDGRSDRLGLRPQQPDGHDAVGVRVAVVPRRAPRRLRRRGRRGVRRLPASGLAALARAGRQAGPPRDPPAQLFEAVRAGGAAARLRDRRPGRGALPRGRRRTVQRELRRSRGRQRVAAGDRGCGRAPARSGRGSRLPRRRPARGGRRAASVRDRLRARTSRRRRRGFTRPRRRGVLVRAGLHGPSGTRPGRGRPAP
jgi:hypothetical protein